VNTELFVSIVSSVDSLENALAKPSAFKSEKTLNGPEH